MKKEDILNEFIKILKKENHIIKDNNVFCNDIKFIFKKNLLTMYKGDLNNFTMNITIDIVNPEKYKVYCKENKNTYYNIYIFYVADVFVSEEQRNKKYSFYLFFNLCIYLMNKFKNEHIFLYLDDCTGYDYKNNIYSKMDFYVEQENNLVYTKDWIRDIYNSNPSELRYGYVPTILNKCKNILNYI